MVAEGADRLKSVLATKGNGSLLRGWRRELDMDGSLDVGFREFCEAALRLGVAVDAETLFGLDSPDSLTLEELAAPEGKLVDRFRVWMTDTFGGPGEMFIDFENAETADADGKLRFDEFSSGLQRHGFQATEEEVRSIFELLDVENKDAVQMEDVMFLEVDKRRREGAMMKAKLKNRREREAWITEVYHEDANHTLPRTHRRAMRVWQAAAVERLPAVLQERRLQWRRRQLQKSQDSVSTFYKHMRQTHGNGVRFWRQVLDPDSRFVVQRSDLGRYCRSVNLDVDLACLWQVLDTDGDGVLSIQEVGSQHAAALARFFAWAKESFGGCVPAWERLRGSIGMKDTWKSDKTMRHVDFMKALVANGWLGVVSGDDDDETTASPLGPQLKTLCAALDLHGGGIVSMQDLEWLDSWQPPAYLAAQPDRQAWEELRAAMLQMSGGHPLKAWRMFLDRRDVNHASWPDFVSAAKRVGFKGNIGGAWRYLDADTSGSITLQEYDPSSCEALASFKEFIESNFGCVEFAFRSMDTDGSGSVCYSELKRACTRLGFTGSVRQLFEFLDVDVEPGKRTLSYKELSFLDSWVPQVEAPQADSDRHSSKSSRSWQPLGTARSIASTTGTLESKEMPPSSLPVVPSYAKPRTPNSTSQARKLLRVDSCPQVQRTSSAGDGGQDRTDVIVSLKVPVTAQQVSLPRVSSLGALAFEREAGFEWQPSKSSAKSSTLSRRSKRGSSECVLPMTTAGGRMLSLLVPPA